MKIYRVIALLALSLFGSASMAQAPSCTGGKDLGNMGPPDLETFASSFSTAGSYTDCYTFNLSSAANSFGGTLEIDPLFNKLDIDVSSVSLFADGLLKAVDTSPLTFSFGALAGGVKYTLAIASTVTNDPGLRASAVGYLGAFATYAAAVPEPATYAMLLLGLLGVGAAVRRGKLR
jgi:PEP-CTERM motif